MDNKESLLKQLNEVRNNFQNELNEIEKRINQLHNETKEIGWNRADENKKYHYINSNGNITESYEDGCGADDKYYNVANYFSNREKAERINFEQTLFRKLQRFADEHNEHEINWDDTESEKYFIEFDSEDKEFKANYRYIVMHFGDVYFSSRKVVELALETFKPDLKKYFCTEKLPEQDTISIPNFTPNPFR